MSTQSIDYSAALASVPKSDRPPHFDVAWNLYREMGSPKFVVAPMVDQSHLAFRMLTRKYGAQLCYTPMMHAAMFSEQQHYRDNNFATCPEDRPVIAQFCANDPDKFLAAARHVEKHVNAVDLNLGCPQGIARKGHYGSYLLSDVPLIVRLGALYMMIPLA